MRVGDLKLPVEAQMLLGEIYADVVALERAALPAQPCDKLVEALREAEVVLRLDGERMAAHGMSVKANKEAHRVVREALSAWEKR